MKQKSINQAVPVGILGMFVITALFALVITYWVYLPTIISVPLNKSYAPLAEDFYRIACNGFFISGVCGVVLGFALPVIFKIFRGRHDKHDASHESPSANQ